MVRRPVYQKPVYFLCIKECWALLPSGQGSRPAAHTKTQRPPAKPLASLYSPILSASQSRQGAAGGGELCWTEEADRLHGSGRSRTESLLAHGGGQQREAAAGSTGWSQRRDVETFSCRCCCATCPTGVPRLLQHCTKHLVLSKSSSPLQLFTGPLSFNTMWFKYLIWHYILIWFFTKLY